METVTTVALVMTDGKDDGNEYDENADDAEETDDYHDDDDDDDDDGDDDGGGDDDDDLYDMCTTCVCA